jgi:hypothetical protein
MNTVMVSGHPRITPGEFMRYSLPSLLCSAAFLITSVAGADETPQKKQDIAPPKDQSPPTLFSDPKTGKTKIGGFGGPSVLGTSVNDEASLLLGAEGGVLIGGKLSLGAAGYGLSSEVNGPRFANGNESAFGFAYGGFMARYQFFTKSPIYVSVGGLVGPGVLTLLEKVSDTEYEYDEDNPHGSIFFVAEPSVQLHASLTRWMRIGVQGSYRFVHGIDVYGLDSSAIRGAAFGANLQFGWF